MSKGNFVQKIVWLMLCVVMIFFGSLALAAQIPSLKMWLQEQIETQLRRLIGLELQLKSVGGIFPLYIELQELSIGNPESPLLYFESIEIIPEWHELLFGRLSFSAIRCMNVLADESKIDVLKEIISAQQATSPQKGISQDGKWPGSVKLPDLWIRNISIQNFRLYRQHSAFNFSGSLQTYQEKLWLYYSLRSSSLFGNDINCTITGDLLGSLDEMDASLEITNGNQRATIAIEKLLPKEQSFSLVKIDYEQQSNYHLVELEAHITPKKHLNSTDHGTDRSLEGNTGGFVISVPRIKTKFAHLTLPLQPMEGVQLYEALGHEKWTTFSFAIEALLKIEPTKLLLDGQLFKNDVGAGKCNLTIEKNASQILTKIQGMDLKVAQWAAKRIAATIEIGTNNFSDLSPYMIRSEMEQLSVAGINLEKALFIYEVEKARPQKGNFVLETKGALNLHFQGYKETRPNTQLYMLLERAQVGDRISGYSLQAPFELLLNYNRFQLSHLKFLSQTGSFLEAECAVQEGKIVASIQGNDVPLVPNIVREFLPIDLRPPKGLHTFSAVVTGPLPSIQIQCLGHFLFEFQIGAEKKLHRLGYSLRGSPNKLSFIAKSTEEGGRLEMTTQAQIMLGPTLKESAFTGSLQGRADLHIVSSSFFPPNLTCEGILESDIHWKGSLIDLSSEGSFTVKDGVFEIPGIGGTLQDIQVAGTIKDRVLEFQSIEARDGGDGTVKGFGKVLFDSHDPVVYELYFQPQSCLLVESDLGYAKGSGTVELKGKGKSLLISGNLIANEALLDLTADFSQRHPVLDVEFATQNQPSTPRKSSLEFDLSVQILNKAEIRGRGLASIWKGNVQIIGPADGLKIIGAINCQSGLFHFAGKDLRIRHGEITVSGNILRNSQLNILAEANTPQITAQAILTGSLERPKVRFQSTPTLSEKEIISYLMFNKSFQEISPIESLQLAHALVEIQQPGGPFSVLDSLKNKLMIDRLDLTSGSETNEVTVQVGKYISDNVIVTVSKDISSEVNRIGLGVDVTTNLRVEAEVGDDADGVVSLSWKQDY